MAATDLQPMAANKVALVYGPDDAEYVLGADTIRIYQGGAGWFFADAEQGEDEEEFDFYGPFELGELVEELHKFLAAHYREG